MTPTSSADKPTDTDPLAAQLAAALNAYDRARADEAAGVRVAWGPIAADLRKASDALYARAAATADYCAKVDGYARDAAQCALSQANRDAVLVARIGPPPGVARSPHDVTICPPTMADGPRAQRAELDTTGEFERVEPELAPLPPVGPHGTRLRPQVKRLPTEDSEDSEPEGGK